MRFFRNMLAQVLRLQFGQTHVTSHTSRIPLMGSRCCAIDPRLGIVLYCKRMVFATAGEILRAFAVSALSRPCRLDVSVQI